jgi:tRNA threonylcarbamoyladenosine biosynthesis protein TsaE
MESTVTRELPDEAATHALGAALARVLEPGCVLYLEGDLGAGKTTLARALLRALGERARVRSPTYTLLETYRVAGLDIAHLDLYRLSDPAELEEAGFRELADGNTVLMIEWPQRAAGALPAPDLHVALQPAGTGRRARLAPGTARGRRLLDRLDPA